MKSETIIVILLLLGTTAKAEDSPALEPLREYLEFADYSAGAITPEQVSEVGLERFFIVDTRRREQFEAGHIPGAIHIEWRQILERQDLMPRDRPILLYCDTGLLSSKAHLALILAGFENAKVLFSGFNNWVIRESGSAEPPG